MGTLNDPPSMHASIIRSEFEDPAMSLARSCRFGWLKSPEEQSWDFFGKKRENKLTEW